AAAAEPVARAAPVALVVFHRPAQLAPDPRATAIAERINQMTSEPVGYDLLILGSGEAGKYLAWTMAKAVLRCAVVERKLIGGSCPNTNCLPSKNEIWSAKVADLVHHADRYGSAPASTAVDMKKALARKRAMVDDLIALHLDNYKASGAELIMGTG